MEEHLSAGDMNLILQSVQAFAEQVKQLSDGVEPAYLSELERKLAGLYRPDREYTLVVNDNLT